MVLYLMDYVGCRNFAHKVSSRVRFVFLLIFVSAATHSVILSDKWMKSLFVPSMELYREDRRVQALR